MLLPWDKTNPTVLTEGALVGRKPPGRLQEAGMVSGSNIWALETDTPGQNQALRDTHGVTVAIYLTALCLFLICKIGLVRVHTF